MTYWRFYWPLALTGMGMVLSIQFQNATLARYPNAVTELAVLALAYGVFGFFNASLQFISQLANVFARSRQANRKTWQFVVMTSITVMLPLLILASTTFGNTLISGAFDLSGELSRRVTSYLFMMCPLILLNAQRHFLSGLLIQAHLTGWVTVCNFVYLASVIVFLIAGFTLDGTPMIVIVGAELTGVSLLNALLWLVKNQHYEPPQEIITEKISFQTLFEFFVPVSTTGVMFALSRPVLFAFVARTPDGLLTIAALRIAFDFSMIFQQAANQFRHFFISFGFDDLVGKQKFMRQIAIGITAIMLVFSLTPLANWLWGDLMNVPNGLIELAIEVLLVMCLMPTVIIYRNYFHSRLMHLRQTSSMAYGSTVRVLGIFAAAGLFHALDWLNHISAAGILIFGFLIEAFIAQQANRRLSQAAKKTSTQS